MKTLTISEAISLPESQKAANERNGGRLPGLTPIKYAIDKGELKAILKDKLLLVTRRDYLKWLAGWPRKRVLKKGQKVKRPKKD